MTPVPDLTSADDGEVQIMRRQDLRCRGVSARVEARRVSDGEWYRPVGGVVASGPLDCWGLLRAAVVRAAPEVSVSAATGAELWLGRTPTGVLELLVPFGRRLVATPGVAYRQTRCWEPPQLLRGWPVTSPARTAAEIAAGDRPEDDRRALVTGLVQRRLVTPAAVARAAAGTPRRARAQVRRLVEEVLAGAESAPEARLWRAQVEARLPVPALNHPIRVASGRRRIDGYLEPLRAGYEVQGREIHEATWLQDTERAAEILVEHRIVLLPIPAEAIYARTEETLARLEGHWRNRAAELRVPMPRFRPPPGWRP